MGSASSRRAKTKRKPRKNMVSYGELVLFCLASRSRAGQVDRQVDLVMMYSRSPCPLRCPPCGPRPLERHRCPPCGPRPFVVHRVALGSSRWRRFFGKSLPGEHWDAHCLPGAFFVRPSGNPAYKETFMDMIKNNDIKFTLEEIKSFESCQFVADGKVAVCT